MSETDKPCSKCRGQGVRMVKTVERLTWSYGNHKAVESWAEERCTDCDGTGVTP